MKRRYLLKSLLIAPFVGLLPKRAKPTFSGDHSSPSSSISSAEPKDKLKCGDQNGTLCPRCKFNYLTMSAEEWVEAQYNPVKELQYNEPFNGKIVSMTTFQGNLWIATERDVYRIKNGFV